MSDKLPELCWSDTIKQFIDTLDEHQKLEEYRRLLVCEFYKDELMQVVNLFDCSDKELSKQKNKIEGVIKKSFLRAKPKALESTEKELESKYLTFIAKGLLADSKEQLNKLKNKNNFYNIWICRCLIDGMGIFPATHVAKLSHSSSGASSLYDEIDTKINGYVTTSNLRNIVVDGAYPDAFFSKQAKFFLLKKNGILLGQELLAGNSTLLREFSEDDHELNRWIRGFQRNLTPSIKSDALAKQIYFPVGNEYHLLTVLVSSSISQSIHRNYFEKSARVSRDKIYKIVEKEKYSDSVFGRLTNVAKLSTVASQPQNVSVLNGSRAGNLSLLCCQPPIWQSQIKPPIFKKSLFFEPSIYWQAKDDIDYLRDFLIRFDRIEISIKDPKRLKWIGQWVGNIIDELLFYIGSIQNLPAGWSVAAGAKLKSEHQYLLDPLREDEDFQTKRENTDWSSVVCKDFADWLNNKLAGKDKKFTPQAQHTQLWYKLFEPELREFVETLEFEHKRKMEVEA